MWLFFNLDLVVGSINHVLLIITACDATNRLFSFLQMPHRDIINQSLYFSLETRHYIRFPTSSKIQCVCCNALVIASSFFYHICDPWIRLLTNIPERILIRYFKRMSISLQYTIHIYILFSTNKCTTYGKIYGNVQKHIFSI
jgi:hypothetical protein